MIEVFFLSMLLKLSFNYFFSITTSTWQLSFKVSNTIYCRCSKCSLCYIDAFIDTTKALSSALSIKGFGSAFFFCPNFSLKHSHIHFRTHAHTYSIFLPSTSILRQAENRLTLFIKFSTHHGKFSYS